jgi:hypothetical protein
LKKYLRCSVIDVNVTSGEDESVVCGANETVVVGGVEDGDDDVILIGIVAVDKGLVFLDCFNFSSVFLDNKSRKHMKPVLTPGLTINEPSDNGKHIFVFSTFKSSSLISRFKISHGSFVNKKHGTELICCIFNNND